MNENVVRRIRKVKLFEKGEKIEIHYETLVNENWDLYTMICNQRARPEFYDAMQELAPHACELLDLPEMWGNGVRITGITLSYGGENETMGAVMSGQKSLVRSSAPFCFNTPHLPAESYSGDEESDSPRLEIGTVDAINALCDEAWLYVQGSREQMGLFDEQPISIDGKPISEMTALEVKRVQIGREQEKADKKTRKKIPIGTTVLGTGPGAGRIQ